MTDQPARTTPHRDALSPREVAARSGFSYHAILRAIRRGDLEAFEPVPGHYRIAVAEYERWLQTPARAYFASPEAEARRRSPTRSRAPDRGSFEALRAIEGR